MAALLLLVTLALAPACGERGGENGAAAASAASGSETAATTGAAPAAAPAPRRRERPVPAFEGWTLDANRLSLSELIGRRIVLFLFDPGRGTLVDPVARAVAAVSAEQGEHNFSVIGIGRAEPEAAKAFVERHGLGFPVVSDPGAGLAERIGVTGPVALVVVDAEGYMVAGSSGFPTDGPDPAAAIESQLREWLRLPDPRQAAQPMLGERPVAPPFSAERLEGGRFELASLQGRPAVLIFFLHTCSHCHKALRFLKEELPRLPEATRPALLGISVVHAPAEVRSRLASDGLDFFPVVLDGNADLQTAYAAQGGVPVLFLLDGEGRIVARSQGWNEERDPALMRMRLARLAGQPAPLLLHAKGYSGSEVCSICHEGAHETWLLTRHATAFETLVRHGADRNAECVGCHVVGWEQPGGWSLAAPAAHLEGVGCESCHGRGGPHLGEGIPASAARSEAQPSEGPGDWNAVCVGCHDTKHSLGFELARFLPGVSHAANLSATHLSLEEKRKLLAERRRPRADLLPSTAAHVGSAACRECHSAEYESWSKHRHAQALDSLEARNAAGDADCLRCHTTGYGRSGGFPEGGAPAAHPDLVGVGCESCHGPGGEHVKPDAPRRGNIVSLGDKCDSCVILQICGGCHDSANDPGFEFAVQEKIDRQRHGTIEAGTGRPKDPAASTPPAPREGEKAS